MDDRVAKFLYDIDSAIAEILEQTEIRGRSYEILCNDIVYQRFIERNISIIGEAMNRILKIDPSIPISSARKIVNTRNLVIHSYDSLDKEIIWGIVIRHLPVLKNEVRQILSLEF